LCWAGAAICWSLMQDRRPGAAVACAELHRMPGEPGAPETTNQTQRIYQVAAAKTGTLVSGTVKMVALGRCLAGIPAR